ncbi:MAG: SAM-dependent methyltransferase, partial [Thermodesulfobacteriota bacterium]
MNKFSQMIIDKIRENGPISFKRFMELSLYHPEFGYYSSGNAKIGKYGDFYTSPSVHSSFGEVISNLIVKAFEVIDTDNFTILEFGAGKGYLAFDILNSLKKYHQKIYNNIEYKIIEIGSDSINFSKDLLKNHSDKIKWINEVHKLKENKLNGIVLSNEFVDAFPFHRIKFINGKINEIYVNLEDDKFVEQYFEVKNHKINQYVNNYCSDLAEGQEIEINLSVRDWLA